MATSVPAGTSIDASIAELIADAEAVPLPRRAVEVTVDPEPAVAVALPRQRREPIRLPESTLSLVQAYAEYGAC